ncbi:serine/threonine protein kinase [Rhodopirellula islandica]|uniref:non-specific serine/threonine protein kinase n=1 Tax=Rhodopirellula islandica TaxID=595434 RepID=A0A0J1BKD1_RHOIS|nr:serine/threonine protein kinase [Rhodopirellula islandica]
MSDLVGCRVGDYQVLRRLGSGGMADVYAAKHLKLRRDAALKVLRRTPQTSQEDLRRFEREAQAAACLNHPSIVQVYEIGDHQGTHFIAQELIDGSNLKQCLQQSGQFTAKEGIEILRCVTEALVVAHSAGVTHRDIKPENIMRSGEGAIKVTDFGLARVLSNTDASAVDLTRAGLTLGTPRYMSPEQIQGHKVDGRSDLYSLGVTLYHLLAGQPPFDAEEPLALAVKHLHEMPQPLDHTRGSADLPPWLVATIMRLLRKTPDERFASAMELLDVIRANVAPSESSLKAIPASNGSGSSTTLESGRSSAAVNYLGSTSATIQLQRVTDAIADDRRYDFMRWVGVIGLALLAALAGWGISNLTKAPSVSQSIGAPLVARASTIQDQYWQAISLNSVPAWKAVAEYFPKDDIDSKEEIYHLKAALQLTRLLMDENRWREASEALASVEQSGNTSRLYRALALVMRYQIQMEIGARREASQTKTNLRNLVEELKNDQSAALETFRALVPLSERLELGLDEPAVIDGPSPRRPV